MPHAHGPAGDLRYTWGHLLDFACDVCLFLQLLFYNNMKTKLCASKVVYKMTPLGPPVPLLLLHKQTFPPQIPSFVLCDLSSCSASLEELWTWQVSACSCVQLLLPAEPSAQALVDMGHLKCPERASGWRGLPYLPHPCRVTLARCGSHSTSSDSPSNPHQAPGTSHLQESCVP